MIYRLKSDPAVTVDALELKVALAFTGPGPFPSGHQIGGPGDFLVTDGDGQRIMHVRDMEAYEREVAPEPVPVAPPAVEARPKASKRTEATSA